MITTCCVYKDTGNDDTNNTFEIFLILNTVTLENDFYCQLNDDDGDGVDLYIKTRLTQIFRHNQRKKRRKKTNIYH